ncbi:MAG: hypothetical protein KBB86_00730 [Candidatus Pacebacteria bacterium]|nr:hypothetical protein [Candidatus Paceibacterota bacterium]
MDSSTIEQFNLIKSDVEKLLRLVDFIDKQKFEMARKSMSFINIEIPLSLIRVSEFNTEDINRLSNIFNKKFIIEKNFLMEDSLSESILINKHLFSAKSMKEELANLLEIAPENNGVIILQLEGNILKKEIGGQVLTCHFKVEKMPLEILTKLSKSNSPLKGTELGIAPNIPRTISEINEKASKDLNLGTKYKLIENEGGYYINNKYKII